ncbi:Alpha/beta hydrolase fold-3 [Niveomyces insectorum RCEF 264]|uniref:Alpha/beta hydrolase fold-3 n=1 Tax=Niveomyces insectorum RCEF 264 TaxID=1081102 RepID=A0A167ZCZ3_9HYPO|nr:Alpha/beta hydrolase fold-3 [Niveomyces insectorum RCEF 264]
MATVGDHGDNAALAAPKTQPSLATRLAFVAPAFLGVARAAVRHLLGLSPASRYVDLRTAVTVALMRGLMGPRHPLSVTGTQELLNNQPSKHGPMWISEYTAPGPANATEARALRDAVVDTIRRLHQENGDDDAQPLPDDALSSVSVGPVEAEWTGHRSGTGTGAAAAEIPATLSERDRYAALMQDVTAPQPTTVLFFHGGGYTVMDPRTHRALTRDLAHRVHGRCYVVRYRLAPAHPFPAQLVDALVSYLTLLYPPPGAFHAAVRPEHIVLAGDSAGGNLGLALVRLLLDFQRHGVTLPWHQVAGATTTTTTTTTTTVDYAEFDYLSTPVVPGTDADSRPPCAAWPATPPRRFLYAATPFVTHPLVTLLLGAADGWRGCPPVYACVGWELTVGHVPGAARCLQGWAAFMRRAVEEPASFYEQSTGTSTTTTTPPPNPVSTFTYIQSKTLAETPMDPEQLNPITEDEVRSAIRERMAAARAAEARL